MAIKKRKITDRTSGTLRCPKCGSKQVEHTMPPLTALYYGYKKFKCKKCGKKF